MPKKKPFDSMHPHSIDEDRWNVAIERRKCIEQWQKEPNKTANLAKEFADHLNCSPATFYRLSKLFSEKRTTTSLVKGLNSGNKTTKRLPIQIEQIVSEIIHTDYLKPQKIIPARVVEEVERRCHELGIKPPAPNTIRSRIGSIPTYEVVRKSTLC